MNWRNPDIEVPTNDQVVWVMLKPHKWRDSLIDSLQSVAIYCGEVSRTDKVCVVNNCDELGWGWKIWVIKDEQQCPDVIAWMPLEEMGSPQFYSSNI